MPVILPILLLGACRRAPEGPKADLARPNFIVIDVDSMRADRMPLVRDGEVATPALARLVKEGVKFTKAYSQSGWTLPALMSLLSGRYPQGVLGAKGSEGKLTLELPEHSLPEILAIYGYTTVGSWGGTLPSHDPAILKPFAQRIDTDEAAADPLNEPLVRWLDGAPPEPFFLYVHAIDLHATPDAVPEADLHRWTPPTPHSPHRQLHELFADLRGTVDLAGAIEHTKSHYDGALAWYDRGLGHVLDVLDDTGLSERTVVIFTSDHGEEFGEHGAFGHHGTHYENVLHVPLVVRDPAMPGGREVPEVVQTIDLAPAVLERAGIPVDQQMDGKSWLPLARGEAKDWTPRDVYSYSSLDAISLRTARWKLAIHAGTCGLPDSSGKFPVCTELYDLPADPEEKRDVEGENPVVAGELYVKLRAWADARVIERADAPAADDPRLAQALKDGGYWGLVSKDGAGPPPGAGTQPALPPGVQAPPGAQPSPLPANASPIQPGDPNARQLPAPVGPSVPPPATVDPNLPPADGALAPADGALGPPVPTETPEERRARRAALRGR